MVERLTACGFTRQMAEDIVQAYRDDLPGLVDYVRLMELLYDDRCEYV